MLFKYVLPTESLLFASVLPDVKNVRKENSNIANHLSITLFQEHLQARYLNSKPKEQQIFLFPPIFFKL